MSSSIRRPGVFTLLLTAVAACADDAELGNATRTVATEGIWFEEQASAHGLVFTHVSGHAERHLMPEIMGGGGALFDMDRDGDLDAYLVQSGSILEPETAPANQLFRNDGEGHFIDVTHGSGADHRGYGMGVACGDFDNDGDEDLYVTNVGRNALLRNENAGIFIDVTEAAGAPGWSTSAAFFDLDRDGDLDLYVASYLDWSLDVEKNCRNVLLNKRDYCDPQEYQAPAQDVLFLNDGLGRFADISAASSVADHPGTGLGLACADFDDDGWIDIFVANDGMPDFLWQNQHDGSLLESGVEKGCAVDENGIHKAGMGVAIADLDRNGAPDLMVCNLNREADSVFMNQGSYFTDRTSRSGLASTSKPFTRFGMALLDFDNDGYFDLYQANGRVNEQVKLFGEDAYAEPNLLFAGTASPRFREVTPRGGTATPLIGTSRAAAFGDVNNDGAIDILVVNRDGPAHLLINRAGASRHWIRFSVHERSGRQALGARVSITVGAQIHRCEVRAASSYLASSDPRVHMGLGSAEIVNNVRVRWADGEHEVFGALSVNRNHVLARGKGQPAQD